MRKIVLIFIVTLHLCGVFGHYIKTQNLEKEHPRNINNDVDEKIDEQGRKEEKRREQRSVVGRTYGMKLTGDRGVIWNDFNKMASYAVGDTKYYKVEKKEEDIQPKLRMETSDEEEYLEHSKKNKENTIEESNGGQSIEYGDNQHANAENDDHGNKFIENDEINENGNDNDDGIEVTTESQKPIEPSKTYGMNLTGNHGVVWNEIHNREVFYHVGEFSKESEENTQHENNFNENGSTNPDSDEAVDTTPPLPSIEEQANSSNEIDNNAEEIIDNTTGPDNSKNDTIKEIIEIIKEVFKNETAKLEELKKENYNNSKDKVTENKDGDSDVKEIENKEELNSPVSVNDDETNVNSVGDDDKREEDADKLPSQLSEFLGQLFKNDALWQWLDDWSKLYVELLMKRLDNHIKDEVAKQVEEYFENPNDKAKPELNQEPSEENIKENNLSNENENKINLEDNSDKINQEDIFESNSNDTDAIINDKDDELATKRRKDKDNENKENDKTPVIQANNIYGNYVGDGNVTNIFIFNVTKSDLVDIKLNNGTNDFFVFANDKIPMKPKPDGNIESAEELNEYVNGLLNGNNTSNGIVENNESIESTGNLEPEYDATGFVYDTDKPLEAVDSIPKVIEISSTDQTNENIEEFNEDTEERQR